MTPGLNKHKSVPYEGLDTFKFKSCHKHGKPVEFVCVDNFKLNCSNCVLYEDMTSKVVDINKVVSEVKESGLFTASVSKANSILEELQTALISVNRASNEYDSQAALFSL